MQLNVPIMTRFVEGDWIDDDQRVGQERHTPIITELELARVAKGRNKGEGWGKNRKSVKWNVKRGK